MGACGSFTGEQYCEELREKQFRTVRAKRNGSCIICVRGWIKYKECEKWKLIFFCNYNEGKAFWLGLELAFEYTT
jgi:hypothetical protein